MPLESFLLPKESIKYTSTKEVEYQGNRYRLHISNLRLILYVRKGMIFKKERIVSERLLDIQSISYKEKDSATNQGLLEVETLDGKMDIIGSRDNIKEILKNLQRFKKIAEENIRPNLYLDKWLVWNEAPARSLAKRVWKDANSCCICGDKRVSFWIFNAMAVVFAKNVPPFATLILARLFCRKHEKEWKKRKMLSYKSFNGLMLLKEPDRSPLGVWVNMVPTELLNITKTFISDVRAREKYRFDMEPFYSDFLTKTSDLILKGSIEEFVKSRA